MSLSGEIVTLLNADTAFKAAITAGAFEAVEISRQLTPGAFDTNQELLPCALVKASTENKAGPHSNSIQTTLNIYLYQRAGSDVIEAAASRIFPLLNERHTNGIWQILFSSEIPLTTDEALNCSMLVQRYNVFRSKL